jgi:hypothetical protein
MKATKDRKDLSGDRQNPSQTNDSLKNFYRGRKIVEVGTAEELTQKQECRINPGSGKPKRFFITTDAPISGLRDGDIG